MGSNEDKENTEFLMSMGFDKVTAEEALRVTTSLESAVNYCLNEQTNTDVTTANTSSNATPAPEECAAEAEVARSLKCGVCEKLFADVNGAEFHAAKTGHADFSESTEEKKPLTEEEKAAKAAELQDKLKARRQEREAQEKKEELEKEKARRKEGKNMVAMKEELRDVVLKKEIEERKREQMEDKLYKERLLEQIRKDKLDRQKKLAGVSSSTADDSNTSVASDTLQKVTAPPVEYDKCVLQIRLTDGSNLIQEFSINESLAAVKLYIEMNRTDEPGNFKLVNSSTFPPKPYTLDDMDSPLKTLNLAPRAMLTIRKDVNGHE